MLTPIYTKILVPILAIFLAIVTLAACTSTTTPVAKPSAKLESATLQGQAEHWKVNVSYLIKDEALEEITTIQFLGLDELNEASVTISHKGQTPLTYNVDSPSLLRVGQALTLSERAKVLSWQDTEQIIVQWKVGSNQFKEYITPTKKEVAATP